MTVRVERAFVFEAAPEDIWAFISDPAKRADAISVVKDYEVHDNRDATWQVSLPIPVINSTISVETEETERDPPHYVRFEGTSAAFRVTGEHSVDTVEDGTKLDNEFIVEGKLPGTEQFFERNFESEIENLEAALREELERR